MISSGWRIVIRDIFPMNEIEGKEQLLADQQVGLIHERIIRSCCMQLLVHA